MIKVTMTGANALAKVLREMTKANESTRREFVLIGRRMVKMQREHFEKQEDVSGVAWPPLSEATIEARRKKSDVLLRDTNRLFTSITAKSTSTDATVGTNLIYAATHQFGDDDRGIPTRQFLYITAEERRTLIRMITDPLILIPLSRHKTHGITGTEDLAIG